MHVLEEPTGDCQHFLAYSCCPRVSSLPSGCRCANRACSGFSNLFAQNRGDVVFLSNHSTPIEIGEMVVFRINGSIPIIHRVVEVYSSADGQVRHPAAPERHSRHLLTEAGGSIDQS